MRIFVSIKALPCHPERMRLVEALRRALEQAGHSIFLASAEIERAGLADGRAFMPFVRREMPLCQALLVVYDAELRGGLIELGMAYALGLPIYLAAPDNLTHISSSAVGCAAQVVRFHDVADLITKVTNIL